jgi:molybdopterin/thiamine biosynthesis adenylyltransferase
MRYTLSFLEDDYNRLITHLFAVPEEQAAYLLCGLSTAERESRLLIRRVIPVDVSDIAERSPVHMQIRARSFLSAMKEANNAGECFVFVHSHPADRPTHSSQDDREERKLFAVAYNRIHTPNLIHASLVFSSPEKPVGRMWLDGGSVEPIETIRVVGRRFQFHFSGGLDHDIDTTFHDRQVRAFGPDLQPLLKRLRIGVVGAGGTGSAVIEQSIRLGIGHLLIADGGFLEKSNVSRVYGSRAGDDGVAKIKIMQRLADEIGLGTELEILDKPITFASVLRRFRDCDAIFGCTDDEWGRSLLNSLSLAYLIPALDLGVKINSEAGVIHSIQGRVTTLRPGKPCLFCRNRISQERIRAEQLAELDPTEAASLTREGYIPELRRSDPAVIAFTTAIAASAVGELLHYLTGFKGPDHDASEILHRFDSTAINTPGARSKPGCTCSDARAFGRGDQRRFLGMNWRPE